MDAGAGGPEGLDLTSGAFGGDQNPRLVAIATPENASLSTSTQEQDLSQGSVTNAQQYDHQSEFFASLEWTSDGTTLLVTSDDHRKLHTYILPPELLAPANFLPYHSLHPYNTISLPEPCHATAIHPSFALSSAEKCLYIASPAALPIRLISPFAKGVLASYPLVNELTEEWIAPHSLLFHPRDPQTFFAGAKSVISVFDLHRNGQEPCVTFPVGRISRRRKKWLASQANGQGMVDSDARGLRSGIVSALAANTEGTLAAGTFTGEVGLFDLREDAGFVGKLGMPPDSGQGVTQIIFHPLPTKSNYLLVGSRGAESSHVFDLRAPQQNLATLQERKANTMQRMDHCISEAGDVWAGGTDGLIKAWNDMGTEEGDILPKVQFEPFGDVVGGIGLHPGCGVLAACAGSRHFTTQKDKQVLLNGHANETDSNDVFSEEGMADVDNKLKIWDMNTGP